MGRKKIEIRPLVDERNRNVTFLKRKAGLMKKAWELSVLCAADVSIIIFSAAGKAYEFSSKELEGELERYYDYEGMIERRRAPEFAAMALAGEDDDDDDDDAGPSARRSSKANASSAATAATANGAPGAQPRSLKGKETFKTRTILSRHNHSSSHAKRKSRRRDKSRSESEKRSFIDSILSGESSYEDEDEDDSRSGRGEESWKRRKDVGDRDRREREREREREKDKDRVRRSKKEAEADRSRDEERAYPTSDKMMAGLQYALNMHSSQGGPSQSTIDPRGQSSNIAGPSRDSYTRDTQLAPDGYPGHPQVPVSVPSAARLPSDGANYRLPHGSGLGMTQLSQASAGLNYAPPLASSASAPFLHPHTGQPYVPSHEPLLQANSAPFLPSTHASFPPNAPTGFQWDRDLIARYAEFQLQQNHQRQQRILLERQRQQLAHLGVPLDDRSLLDEIFGGMSGAQAAAGGSANGGNGRGGDYLPVGDEGIPQPSGDFVWPLGSSSGGGGGDGRNLGLDISTPMDGYGNGYDAPHHPHGGHGHGQDMGWSMDGFEGEPGGMGGGGRDGMSLPSPVSASAGEGRRKGGSNARGREYEEDVGSSMGKRMRV